MHILMFAPADREHTLRPLRWLLDAGHRVTLVSRVNPNIAPRERYTFVHYPYIATRWWRKLLGSNVGDRIPIACIKSIVTQAARQDPITLVHVHWVDFRAYYCAKADLRPLVLSVWGTDINQHFTDWGDASLRDAAHYALAHADNVIVDADGMAEKSERLAGKSLHCSRIHLGVNTTLFHPNLAAKRKTWREKLNIRENVFLFLSPRGWLKRYRHHVILEAFSLLCKRTKQPIHLALKTFDPLDAAYICHVERLIEKLGVTDKVSWIAHVPAAELPGVYSAADAIVNAPQVDTFPTLFLEAAACGKPVVTNLLDSYRNTFAEQQFYLAKPDTAGGFAEAMMQVLLNADKDSLVRQENALKAVCSSFTEEIAIQRLLQLYEKLASADTGDTGNA